MKKGKDNEQAYKSLTAIICVDREVYQPIISSARP